MKDLDPELLSFVPGRMVIGGRRLNNDEIERCLATLARMSEPAQSGSPGRAADNEVNQSTILDALGVLAEQMIGRCSPADEALKKGIQAATDRHRGR